jgi:hypothetical protein
MTDQVELDYHRSEDALQELEPAIMHARLDQALSQERETALLEELRRRQANNASSSRSSILDALPKTTQPAQTKDATR